MKRERFCTRVLLLMAITALSIGQALAYPPAPAISIHGLVRDQYGWVLRWTGAEVVLKSDDLEVARQPIVSHLRFSENFRIQLPLDSGLSGLPYRTEALLPDAYFTLEVHIDKKVYYPIETFLSSEDGGPPQRGAFAIEEAGETIRLDLTLGEDLDGDGLPDDWEYWQLEAAGLRSGDQAADLAFFNGTGDADGDGLSDLAEFHAGTLAMAAGDAMQLQVVGHLRDEGLLELKYRALNDKAYVLETSEDGQAWVSAPVLLDDPASPPQTAWFASQTAERTIFAPVEQHLRIFRLRVR